MKKIIALASSLLLSVNVLAEKAITVAYESGHIPVSSSVDIEAEYLALELQLNANADSSAERADLTSALIDTLNLAATKDLSFEFQVADQAVAPYTRVVSATEDASNSEPTHYLLTLLSPEETIYQATQKLHNFLKQIRVPAKTSITAGKTALAISAPESYRDQLLHLLEKELEKLGKMYPGSTRVYLYGLENPVNVRRKSDKKVSLYLDYEISIEMKP